MHEHPAKELRVAISVTSDREFKVFAALVLSRNCSACRRYALLIVPPSSAPRIERLAARLGMAIAQCEPATAKRVSHTARETHTRCVLTQLKAHACDLFVITHEATFTHTLYQEYRGHVLGISYRSPGTERACPERTTCFAGILSPRNAVEGKNYLSCRSYEPGMKRRKFRTMSVDGYAAYKALTAALTIYFLRHQLGLRQE